MSYKILGFTVAQKVIANCDKASLNNQSKVIRSPWGIFTMYRVGKNGRRYYSIRGSKVFANRGSLLIGTIKRMLRGLIEK